MDPVTWALLGNIGSTLGGVAATAGAVNSIEQSHVAQNELRRNKKAVEDTEKQEQKKVKERNARYGGMRQNLFSGEAGGYNTSDASFQNQKIIQ
jgi:hypothetical protein